MPYDQCLSEVCLTPLSVSLCFCLICIYVLLYYYIDVVYIIRISVKIGRSLLVVQGLRLGLIVRDESVSLLFDCLSCRHLHIRWAGQPQTSVSGLSS